MTVTVIHPNNGKRPYALNEQGRKVLGSGYYSGRFKPNYPVPAIPLIHQWDFSLWVLLHTMPTMTDDEWQREEDEWQDYLDGLDE